MMDKNFINLTIKNSLKSVCNDANLVIQDEMKIFEDYKLDSLDFAEFVQITEQELGFKIDMSLYLKWSEKSDFRNMTFSDYVNYVTWIKDKIDQH